MKKVHFNNFEEMLTELDASDRGRYYICQCPECEEKEAFIYKNNMKFVKCNREENCGERVLIQYKVKDDELETDKYADMAQEYPNLTKEQRKDLEWVSGYVKHFRESIVSPSLDDGYRGLSRDVTTPFIAEIQHVEGLEKSPLKLFYERTKSLTGKDYTESEFMLNRNIIIPITDEHNNIERVLLRSTVDKDAKPKEIQLVLNPSKETKDFFVDLKEEKGIVVITEALFDGMSFKEVYNDANYLALTGVNRTKKALEYIEENRELFANKRIIVAMDNDDAGKKAEEKIINFLNQRKIGLSYSSFEYGDVDETINDPNDFLVSDKELFTQRFRNALKMQLNNELRTQQNLAM